MEHEAAIVPTPHPARRLGPKYRNVSISHATLREEDLIERFENFLTGQGAILEPRGEHSDEDDSVYLNEYLFDAMDAIAPEGCRFGAHEGDGSDFGFWAAEADAQKGGA